MRRTIQLLISIVVLIFVLLTDTVAWTSEANTGKYADSDFVYGYAFALLGEYQKAVAKYKTHISTHPESVEGYNNIGNAHYQLGSFDDAITAYEQAVKKSPNLAVPHYNLANVLIYDKPDRAIKEYKKAIDLDQGLLEAYNNLGLALQSKEEDMAIEYFRKGLRLSADRASKEQATKIALVHFNLACLLHEQRFQEIQDECNQADRKSENLLSESTKTRDMDIAQRKSLATEQWAEKISACGDDFKCKKIAVRKWRQELKNIASSQQLIPGHKGSLGHRIDTKKTRNSLDRCLERNADKFEDVIREYSAALQSDPNSYQFHNNLGTVYLETGRFKKAIEQYRKALHLDPYSIFVHNNLGVTFFKQAETKKGDQQYRMVSWLRKKLLTTELYGAYRQHLAAGVSKGRVAERGLGSSERFRLSQMRHFQPEGSKQSIPIMLMWNVFHAFGQLDLPSEMTDKLQQALAYSILSEELFHHPNIHLLQPVVRILSIFSPERRKMQVGTGFVADRDGDRGYIVTAYHNLYQKKLEEIRRDVEAMEIVVQFFTPIPTAQRATIVWKSKQDNGIDLALLRVNNLPPAIPVAGLGDSSSKLQDEDLFIVGNPGGERWKLTTGVLQAFLCNKDQIVFKGENGKSLASGYSGGPVYGADSGRIVGLYTQTAPDTMEMAIPAERIKKILQEFQQNLSKEGEING